MRNIMEVHVLTSNQEWIHHRRLRQDTLRQKPIMLPRRLDEDISPKAKLSGTDGAARGKTKIFLGLSRVVTEEDKVNGGSFHDNIDNE